MSLFKKFREHLNLLKNIVSQRFLMRTLGLIFLLLISCGTKTIVNTKPEVNSKLETSTKPAIAIDNDNSDLSIGKTLFENNCANCHQLYDSKEFDKNEWKAITKRMQKKAQLTDVEILKVYNYLVIDLK